MTYSQELQALDRSFQEQTGLPSLLTINWIFDLYAAFKQAGIPCHALRNCADHVRYEFGDRIADLYSEILTRKECEVLGECPEMPTEQEKKGMRFMVG